MPSDNIIVEKEIEYWSKHFDLDKFNFDRTTSNFLAQMGIIISVAIGVSAIIVSYTIIGSFLQFIFLLLTGDLMLLFSYFALKRFNKEINNHNLSLMTREEMLRRRYKLLGVSKAKLNKEFTQIKRDYKEGKLKLPYSGEE